MAKTLQFRRGTTAELSSVTGAVGELFVDTQKNTLLVHDGTTGHELVAQDGDATLNSALIGDVSIVGNTVSGVDSYGNPDSLVVDGDLTVRYDTIAAASQQFTNNTYSAPWAPTSPYGSGTIYFSTGNGWTTEQLNALDAIEPGTVVQFSFVTTPYGASSGNFTVVSSSQSVDYYGATILSLQVTNVTVTGGNSSWVGYTPLNISDFNLSWSTTTGSIVDVLDVTSTGVAITGTLTANGNNVVAENNLKTVNGQSIVGSGDITISGGASYDQSLNTTDDVVFNSALVGDVSIIGNTVSGVDSYGNPDLLVVDGDLTVRYDSQVTTTSTFSNFTVGSAYTYFSGNGSGTGGTFTFNNSNNNGWSVGDLTTLASLQPGTVVQFTNLSTSYGTSSGSFTVVSSTGSTYYGSPIVTLIVSNISITAGAAGWTYGDSVYNFDFAWSSITGTVVDVLDVTSTGVDITGSLTVNGQAITAGGASYDQSLNTTDDVAFNSAIVGDVSIIGNTVSGVDSYGNPDTLVVDGGLQVKFGSSSTGLGSVTLNSTPAVNYNGSSIIINVADGWTQEQVSYFANMPSAPIITLTSLNTSAYGNFSSGSLSISNVIVISATYVVLDVASFVIDGYGPVTGSPTFFTAIWTFLSNVTTNTLTTSLDVTSTGVDVIGALTVNGQAITAGASYDQSLNTTDDVVFNSVLAGDVSIVGNTVSGLDSYGNADTLIVDGDLNVTGGLTVNGTAVGGLDTHGAVGSYAMLALDSGSGNISFGQLMDSFPTGPLRPAGLSDPGTGFGIVTDSPPPGVSGTWKCMGHAPSNSGTVVTLWYRVA
jgi:hypothetical protein